ncbi:glycoside hydrolase [Adhaeribacter arboris]|uniref:Glycoside hydrolase n=2 Tax=Adhaeribacter arboris TaxID=2072846 RepID=A0A2T2YP46_9BACT|nr:glycoside hydrolase [Adhaeribacter arboris]
MALPNLLFAQPTKQTQFYISNDDHTDYMWTGNEKQYKEAFIKMLDYYIGQSDKTANLPAPYQSRFNCDGSYWLWEYEKNKSPAEFEKLISKIKSGHISVPYNAVVSCYGASPTEGILRGMYYAGYLQRRYNLDLDQAVAMENQTLPLGLGSLWAGAGVKYSWKGVCDCASQMKDLKKRNKEVYWYTGLDNSKVLMKWYSIAPGGNKQLGGYAEARDPALAVDQLTALCQSPAHPYHIAGAFGFGWDDLQTTTDIFTTTAQAKTNAQRQVIVSNQSDYFKAFEAAYGKVIPEESLAYGNEWDLYSASMAELSAKVKRSVEKLRAAEAMASLVSQQDKNFAGNLADLKKTAWMALGLYYEHDWTADGPVSREDRAAWQRKIENQLTTYVDTLYNLSQQKLGTYIKTSSNKTQFYVFNPLSWQRTDVCDFPYTGTKNVRVIDTQTNQEVPSQLIKSKGKEFIRILATDIPSVGYKVFEITSSPAKALPKAATYANQVFENSFYKLKITNQGVITSFVDKRQGNKEYAAQVNGKFMNDLGSGSDNIGSIVIEHEGPVSVTILCTGQKPLAHTSRITLFKEIPRVDIENQITQNFGEVQSWAFSYNLTGADVWHEETGTILKAKPVIQGGNYATQNARFDWLTLNHFAAINNGKQGITLSNADCAFLKLGNSALTNLDTKTAQISVLAGGQVDGAKLGILKQGGDSLFTQRFALSTNAGFNAAASMRFSLEHQNPLVAGRITGTQTIYSDKTYSFLKVSDPNVLLWSLKPAEEGAAKGIITRLWNFKNNNSPVKLSFTPQITTAHQTTHVETDLNKATILNGSLQETIGHHQIKTFRVVLENAKATK